MIGLRGRTPATRRDTPGPPPGRGPGFPSSALRVGFAADSPYGPPVARPRAVAASPKNGSAASCSSIRGHQATVAGGEGTGTVGETPARPGGPPPPGPRTGPAGGRRPPAAAARGRSHTRPHLRSLQGRGLLLSHRLPVCRDSTSGPVCFTGGTVRVRLSGFRRQAVQSRLSTMWIPFREPDLGWAVLAAGGSDSHGGVPDGETSAELPAASVIDAPDMLLAGIAVP